MKFFDLDNTICESRQVISKKMKDKLASLGDFVVISGAEMKRIEEQMDGVYCIKMAQNGNHTSQWRNKLTDKEINKIWAHLEKVSKFTNIPIDKHTYQNRGCQVSFSFTGHDANQHTKNKFDPNKVFRRLVLENVPFKAKGLQVSIAGSTCLDYNRKGCSKGDNLKRYMELKRLKKEDCVYYGDNLQKGGNDESVLGVMRCVAVKNPDHLLEIL